MKVLQPVERFFRRHLAYFDLVFKVLSDKEVNAHSTEILKNKQGFREKLRRLNANVMEKGNEVFWSEDNLRLRGWKPQSGPSAERRERNRQRRKKERK